MNEEAIIRRTERALACEKPPAVNEHWRFLGCTSNTRPWEAHACLVITGISNTTKTIRVFVLQGLYETFEFQYELDFFLDNAERIRYG